MNKTGRHAVTGRHRWIDLAEPQQLGSILLEKEKIEMDHQINEKDRWIAEQRRLMQHAAGRMSDKESAAADQKMWW